MNRKLLNYKVDWNLVLVIIIALLFVGRANGLNVGDMFSDAFSSLSPFWSGGGGGGDDGTGEGEDTTPPLTPIISMSLNVERTPHHPRTPVIGSITTNTPNTLISIEEKLEGNADPYGISGWPHTWIETYTVMTDGSGSASAPFTCITPGSWEVRATLVNYGVTSEIKNLEVLGVSVDVPQEEVYAGNAITIRIFSSYYSQSGFTAWESTDGWATQDALNTLTSDIGGYTYCTLYTGYTGTHEFRGQAPDGTYSYNTESCIVKP